MKNNFFHITFKDKNEKREENSPHVYADYNTKDGFYTFEDLVALCREWTEEDNDGTVYYLIDECGNEYFL